MKGKNTVSAVFPPEDLERITKAVSEVESTTSAEIVPAIVDRSDDYEEALWRAGAVTSSIVLGFFAILSALTDIWLPFGVPGIVAIVLLSAALAMLKVRWLPFLRRWFAGNELMTRRVARMAKELFLTEQVFATRERTGILLLISLLEHKVVILTDSGIRARIDDREWDNIVRCVVNGLRSGSPASGVVDGLNAMAQLLQGRGFARTSEDRNELPDRPREPGRPA